MHTADDEEFKHQHIWDYCVRRNEIKAQNRQNTINQIGRPVKVNKVTNIKAPAQLKQPHWDAVPPLAKEEENEGYTRLATTEPNAKWNELILPDALTAVNQSEIRKIIDIYEALEEQEAKEKQGQAKTVSEFDPVQKPQHYNVHPSGVECIDITQHMNFCMGNAIKYIWRADLKGKPIEDLEKAVFYLQAEIVRRLKEMASA